MNVIVVKFKKMSETAKLPERPKFGNVGWDISSDEDVVLAPGTTKKISTNIQLAEFSNRGGGEYAYMKIEGRSGLAAKGIFPVGGIIDPNYRGEIGVVLTYNNRFADNYQIKKGDRIAQLVFYSYHYNGNIVMEEAREIQATDRGNQGFGSSGR